MKTIQLFLSTLFLVGLSTGCGKKSAPPIPYEQAPQVLTDSFKDAKPEIAAEVKEIAIMLRQDNGSESFSQINDLAAQPDLNDEQRAAAYRVAASVHKKMVEDAARGDKKAQEALEHYRATK